MNYFFRTEPCLDYNGDLKYILVKILSPFPFPIPVYMSSQCWTRTQETLPLPASSTGQLHYIRQISLLLCATFLMCKLGIMILTSFERHSHLKKVIQMLGIIKLRKEAEIRAREKVEDPNLFPKVGPG